MSTDKYSSWPKVIAKYAKAHRKQNVKLAAAGSGNPASAAVAVDPVILQAATKDLISYLGIQGQSTEQDKFLLSSLPQILTLLGQVDGPIPDSIKHLPVPSKQTLEQTLQTDAKKLAQGMNLTPQQWPVLIQICSMLLHAWKGVVSLASDQTLDLLVRVVKAVMTTLWSSGLFPQMTVVFLCLDSLIELYLSLRKQGFSFSNLFACCCAAAGKVNEPTQQDVTKQQ